VSIEMFSLQHTTWLSRTPLTL